MSAKITQELYEKVECFRDDNDLPTRTEALRLLLLAGLKVYDVSLEHLSAGRGPQ